jgi:polysaccharide biosynthesis protein PslG
MSGVVLALLITLVVGTLLLVRFADEGSGAQPGQSSSVAPVTADAMVKGIGLSVPTFPLLSKAQQIAWLKDFRALGITWMRIDITWAVVQPVRGPYNWALYNRAVDEANAYGIRVDAQATYSAPWAVGPGCPHQTTECQPASAQLYAAYAGAIARHFGSKISAEEIWNEPNSAAFWQPAPNPAFYVQMLKHSYVAIKAADPRIVVVSGGLAPGGSNSNSISPVTFTRDMYQDGAKGYFNALGDHPYSYPALPSQYKSWSAWSQMSQTSPSIRSVMTAYGDAATPVWITEVGAPTDGPGAAAGCGNDGHFTAHEDYEDQCLQAQGLTQVVQDERSLSWLGPAFIYSFQDLGTNPDSQRNFFGIRTAAGTSKLSYNALKQAIAGSTGHGRAESAEGRTTSH